MTCQKELLVDELLDILERLAAIYRELRTLGDNKKRVLASADLTSLEDIIRKEQEKVSLVETIEKRRLILQNSIHGSSASFSELIAALDERRKERAIFLQRELKQLVKSLQLNTNVNNEIIQHLLNFSKHNMNVKLGVSTVPTYGDNDSSFNGNKGLINKII